MPRAADGPALAAGGRTKSTRLTNALLLLPLALTGCVEAPEVDAFAAPIVGGQPTPEGKYPAVGALLEDDELFCTGTLIRPDVVLTAAHCLRDSNDPARLGFALARDVVSTSVTQTRVRTWVMHERFHLPEPLPIVPDELNDIALVFLAAPIAGVTPALLPTPAEASALAPGAALEIVGYGGTDLAGEESGVKFDATTDLVAVGAFELQLSSPGRPQKCYGDSGGPAFASIGGGTRLVGVGSRTASDAEECAFGSLETRVDAYRAWIQLHLDRLPPPGASAPDAGSAPPPRDRDGDDGEGGGCAIGRTGATPSGPSAWVLVALVAWLARRRLATRGSSDAG